MEWPLLLHGSGRCSRLHAACQSQAAGRGFRRRRDGHGTSGNDPRLELCEGQSDRDARPRRSEEHTSELQSLMRISYAVFCLKEKTKLKIKNIMRISTM